MRHRSGRQVKLLETLCHRRIAPDPVIPAARGLLPGEGVDSVARRDVHEFRLLVVVSSQALGDGDELLQGDASNGAKVKSGRIGGGIPAKLPTEELAAHLANLAQLRLHRAQK